MIIRFLATENLFQDNQTGNMKKIIILSLSFFVIINTSIAQKNGDTSGFPTIENNPHVELQEDYSEFDPDNMNPNVKETESQKQAVIGKRSSFFTDIIYGTLLVILVIIGWNMYQRYISKSVEEIE